MKKTRMGMKNRRLDRNSIHYTIGSVSEALETSGASGAGKGVFGFGLLWRERQ
jgi:hypothetical protein